MWVSIIVKIVILLSGITNLFLALYVLSKNRKEKVNKTFCYFGVSIFFWCLANFLMLVDSQNIFWARCTYSIALLLTLTNLYFAYALANKKMYRWWKIILFIYCVAFFLITAFTPLVLVNTSLVNDTLGFAPVYGKLFYAWGATFMLIYFYAVIFLIFSIKKVTEQRKKQIYYYLIGTIFFGGWGTIVSIILPFLGNNQFVNLDSPASIFIVAFTSYSIVRYDLMGISSFFFVAFIYTLSLISIIAALMVLMSIGSYLYVHSMVLPMYAIAIITAITLVIIGRIFFKEKSNVELAKNKLAFLLNESENSRKQIQLEKEKTETVINSFVDGLIVLNQQNEIISINEKAKKMFLLFQDKLIKQPYQTLAVFPRFRPVVSILEGGFEKNINNEQVVIENDFVVELSVAPLKLNEEEIGHMIILHDISRDAKINDLEKMNKLMVGRELKMAELKKQIEELKNKNESPE